MTFVDADSLLGLGCILILAVHLAGGSARRPAARRARGILGAGAVLAWAMVALGAVVPLVTPGAQRALALVDTPLFLVALLVMIVGLDRFPAMPATAFDRLRQWLEAAVILVVSALVFWELVVAHDLAGEGTLSTGRIVLTLLAPGMLAVLAVSVLTARARECEAGARRALACLAAGVLVVLAALWAQPLTGSVPGAVPPLWAIAACWIGVVMAAVAATCEVARARRGRPMATAVAPGHEARVPGAVAMAAVVAGYALLLAGGLGMTDLHVDGLIVGAALMTTLLMARQWLALRENAALSARMTAQALTDELTGLSNRRALLEACQEPVDDLAVVVFDIDNFKDVNDTHGHAVGDAALREVAARCRRHVRANDLLGRLGGDEFVALLPGAGEDGARRVAAALRDAVAAEPIDADGATVAVTISLGVAAAPPGDLYELLGRADRALYEEKGMRRGRGTPVRTAGAA